MRFDISHTRGEATVASCVVFGPLGAMKSDYRRFNIEGITPGDDYAAMHQALSRRYSRLKKEEAVMPDLLLIDGGAGQVAQAVAVLAELQIEGIMVVGVAKGGVEEGVDSLGQSAIIAPSGQIVAQAFTTGDELVIARCDLDWCYRYKGTLFDFDRYRRPEVYDRITSQRGVVLPD
jgi:excinuclease UvrABC nuclease subunit